MIWAIFGLHAYTVDVAVPESVVVAVTLLVKVLVVVAEKVAGVSRHAQTLLTALVAFKRILEKADSLGSFFRTELVVVVLPGELAGVVIDLVVDDVVEALLASLLIPAVVSEVVVDDGRTIGRVELCSVADVLVVDGDRLRNRVASFGFASNW